MAFRWWADGGIKETVCWLRAVLPQVPPYGSGDKHLTLVSYVMANTTGRLIINIFMDLSLLFSTSQTSKKEIPRHRSILLPSNKVTS